MIVALSPKDKMIQNFRKQFIDIDGQYYFVVRDLQWMLPVDEDTPWKKEKIFLSIYGALTVVTWVIIVGIGFYLILLKEIKYFLIFIPFIFFGTLAQVIAFTLPNMDLWNRLRSLNAQPDEIKSNFLVRKPPR